MGQFNNREIASAVWLFALLGFALSKPDIRRSILGLLRAFFQAKILVYMCVLAMYVTASVALLSTVSLWNTSLLKDTILWFCFGAVAMTFNAITAGEAGNVFRKILVDSIKIIILIEFLVNTYTFSLGAELLIVPILAVITMLDVVANSDRKFSVVARLTGALQVIMGLTILAFAASRAAHDFRSLQNLDTVRSIILSPLLSILLSPLVYMMVLTSKYELVFVRLNLGVEKDKGLKRYARRRILMHAGLSLRKLHRILSTHACDLMDVETKADVDGLLQPKQIADLYSIGHGSDGESDLSKKATRKRRKAHRKRR